MFRSIVLFRRLCGVSSTKRLLVLLQCTVGLVVLMIITSKLYKFEKNLGEPLYAFSHGDWQVLDPTTNTFIYSAYSIEPGVAVIIAIANSWAGFHGICAFSFTPIDFRRVPSEVVHLIRGETPVAVVHPEHWYLDYAVVFFRCKLPANMTPPYVSLIPPATDSKNGGADKATNQLRIQYTSQLKTKGKVDFAICVNPIYDYDQVGEFLEWFEFYKLMGVRMFTFYNMSIGPRVSCVMQQLASLDSDNVTINVLPWQNLHFEYSQLRGGSKALAAVTHDCIYRHRERARYIVYVDLDEIIVPKLHDNFSDMINPVNPTGEAGGVGCFSFRNIFFPLQQLRREKVELDWNFGRDTELARKISEGLRTLRLTLKEDRVFVHGERSKYICNPDAIALAGTHLIYSLAGNYTLKLVPPRIAAMHHYRLTEGPEAALASTFVDMSVIRFKQNLVRNLVTTYKRLKGTCNLGV